MVVFAATHLNTEAKAPPTGGERKEQMGIQCSIYSPGKKCTKPQGLVAAA